MKADTLKPSRTSRGKRLAAPGQKMEANSLQSGAPKHSLAAFLGKAKRFLVQSVLRAGDRCYATVVGKTPLRGVVTQVSLSRNGSKTNRRLEIGPGFKRIPDFETLSIHTGWSVDYICDATKALPFPDGTFEVVYASHVLEHIPWYSTETVLEEWMRVLRPGGSIEIWVPDAAKVCKAFVDFEYDGVDNSHEDGWYKFNEEKDVCKWAAGRIFSYGDGEGTPSDPNWHRAIFSPRYLRKVLSQVGFVDIQELDRSQVRGNDHGWINLGMKGCKP